MRVWVACASRLDLKKKKGRTRKKGAARPQARTHLEVNHPESNRLRAPTVIYNKQLGVYWRLRLATMTTDASKNRFRSRRRTLSRANAPRSFRRGYLRPILFVLTSINVDEPIYGRRSRPVRDCVAKSLLPAMSALGRQLLLLVRLFGGVRRVSTKGGLSHGWSNWKGETSTHPR